MTTEIEERVQLAARLYDARSAARTIYGATYATRMTEWIALLRRAMAETQQPPLSACLVLCEQAPIDSTAPLFLMAAAVEIIEADECQERPVGGTA